MALTTQEYYLTSEKNTNWNRITKLISTKLNMSNGSLNKAHKNKQTKQLLF